MQNFCLLKGQLKEMYYSIVKSKCELERQVIENTLPIASQNPAEVAHKIMKDLGYTGVVAGEVLHIIKCLRVETQIRPTDECYEQVPVIYNNETLFLSPRTRILVGNGKQITCEGRLPTMFKIGQTWIRSLPKIIDAPQPEILSPKNSPKWRYVSPESLAISGIYSEKDTRKLRDLIVFPLERGAVLNKILKSATGQQVNTEGISISPFLTEKILNDIASNTWNKVWNGFTSFGTASAGLKGLFMCIRMIKLIVDTTIHSYALYTIYGWSLHLLGALWDSVFHLLVHLGQQRRHEAVRQDLYNRIDQQEINNVKEFQGVEVRQFEQPDMRHEAENIPQRPVAPPPPKNFGMGGIKI
uniref:Uncharacterized protein n=1 Tax=Trichogramma kaykai TaxID=54128 RepID=A0ABD2X044_9HYME